MRMWRRWSRWSSLVMAGLLFLLTACGRQTAVSPKTDGFRCRVVASYDGTEAEGTLIRDAAGMLTLEMTKPDTLSGMSIRWDGEAATVKLHGLSFSLDPELLPAAGVGNSLLKALDASVGISQGEMTSEGYEVRGTCEAGEFILLSDPETGALRSLTVPSLGFRADFLEFELKK